MEFVYEFFFTHAFSDGKFHGAAPGMRESPLSRPDPAREEGGDPNLPFGTQIPMVSWRSGQLADRVPLRRIFLILVFLVCAIYMATHLKRSWAPEDEGTLGQSAERVLQGQLPHRDFDDVYTGGLSFLNATAFRIFGPNLASMRYVLYLFFLAWVPATYFVASRFVSAPLAGAVTLLAVVWSLPNYPAAMPSWYNLFFATFGLAALLRYIEAPKPVWLFLAGICGGLSSLFKVSGLFFVAGALLFLLFRGKIGAVSRYSRWYRVVLIVAVVTYEGVFLELVHKSFSVFSFAYFFVPAIFIGGAILYGEFRNVTDRAGSVVSLIRELVPFGIGVLLPIFLFLIPYALSGSVWDFVRGTFILPGRRFLYVSTTPTKLRLFGGIVADLAIIAGVFFTPPRIARAVRGLVILGFPIVLILSPKSSVVLRSTWSMIWLSLPIVIVAGVLMLIECELTDGVDAKFRQNLFLLLAVTANCSLVQFPYISPQYFLYIAPLALLTSVAVVSVVNRPPHLLLVGTYLFLLMFMVLDCTPGWVLSMGSWYRPDTQTAILRLPRAGGLRGEPEFAAVYQELGQVIGRHAQGPYIYATPDCPEVYFLFGFRNPTRTLWDFVDDPTDRTKRILATIAEHHVNLVVINKSPFASHRVPADLRVALQQMFPNEMAVEHFEVRWRP